MISFCDNGCCPNNKLEMNDEMHYHSTDKGVYGGICGILKTHRVSVKFQEEVMIKESKFGRFFNVTETRSKIKNYHFCDVCYNMAIFLKGIDYE